MFSRGSAVARWVPFRLFKLGSAVALWVPIQPSWGCNCSVGAVSSQLVSVGRPAELATTGGRGLNRARISRILCHKPCTGHIRVMHWNTGCTVPCPNAGGVGRTGNGRPPVGPAQLVIRGAFLMGMPDGLAGNASAPLHDSAQNVRTEPPCPAGSSRRISAGSSRHPSIRDHWSSLPCTVMHGPSE